MCARFADQYLKTRDKLSGLLDRVDGLATKSHTKVEGLVEIQSQLGSSLCFLTCGESVVGRADFLDALLGFKVSSALKSKKWSGAMYDPLPDEASIPFKQVKNDALENFQCVEAVPSDMIDAEVDDALYSEWLEKSDVIFWVLSAENPWSGATWGLMERLTPEQLDRSVLILSHTEAYSEDELEVILGHMRNLCSQRVSRSMEVYPVAYKKANVLGLGDVWEFVNELLENAPRRKTFLVQVRDKIERVLDLIEVTVDKRAKLLDGDRGFLSSLEADIDRQKERETQLYAGRGVNLGSEFVEHIEPMLDELHRHCGVVSSTIDLFRSGRVSVQTENYFIEYVSSAFTQRGRSDCMKILLDCREHWRGMHEHLDERLGGDVGEFEQDSFKNLLPKLKEQQAKEVRSVIMSMKIRHTIDVLLEPRRKKIKRWLAASFIFAILAGVAGTINIPPSEIPALSLLALSIGSLIIYGFSIYVSRSGIIQSVADRVVDLRADFREGMSEGYQYMISEFFTGYTPMFEAMRRQIADSKINLEPLQQEHHHLFLELKALENEVML